MVNVSSDITEYSGLREEVVDGDAAELLRERFGMSSLASS